MKKSPGHSSDALGTSSISPPEDASEIQEGIEDSIHNLLEDNLTDNKGKAARIIGMLAIRLNKGPIPPPQTLREYDDVQPGLGKRIVKAWEDQELHRRGLEERFFTKNQARHDRAQHYALILAIIGVLGAVFLDFSGASPVVAIFALIVCIGGPMQHWP